MQSTDNRRRLDRNHSIHLIYTYLTLAEDHVGQPVRVTDLRADPLAARLPRLLGPAPGPGPLAWAQLSVHLTPLHQLGAHRPRPPLPRLMHSGCCPRLQHLSEYQYMMNLSWSYHNLSLQSVLPVRNLSPDTRARLVTLCCAAACPPCTQLCRLLLSTLQIPT